MVATMVPNLTIVPANADLVGLEREMHSDPARPYKLRDALAQLAVDMGAIDPGQSAGYVLIDCPPSLNLLTLNAMVAALLTFLSAFHRDGPMPVAVALGVATLVVALIPPAMRKITHRGFDPYERPTAS